MKIDKDNILIGSDFEMFLVNNNNEVISAIPYNKGTKRDPEPAGGEGFFIQRDGVLQEVNVPAVRIDEAEKFVKNVKYITNYVYDNICRPNDLDIEFSASRIVNSDQLDNPEACEFGCEPDFNAWKDGEINDKPSSDAYPGLRCCGGHLHFSYKEANIENMIDLMKCFDLFVTLPISLLDKDEDRKKLYGKAGAFRPKQWGNSYGFEARTLSNFAFSTPAMIEYVFNQINQFFDYYNNNGVEEVNIDNWKIIEAINESNKELAIELCNKYNIKFDLGLIEREIVPVNELEYEQYYF